MSKKLMNLAEIADALQVKKATLYLYIAENRYGIREHLLKIGQSWRMSDEGFDGLLESIKAVNQECAE